MGFGIYHGLNPGMGWLFAVALALQEQRPRALWSALPPIALGHLLALGAVATPLLLLDTLLTARTLGLLAAGVLLMFGVWRLARWYRHPRWVGMRVSSRDLVVWSGLMATAHGAGLMLAPVLLALMSAGGSSGTRAGEALAGIVLHTAVLLGVMTATAWVVYRRVGLAILRTHWFNFDLVWSVALLLTGALALGRVLRMAP